MTLPDLPVSRILPDLRAALAGTGNAVLVAPPGAGKTTLVPLALLGEDWRGDGTILILEPRRLAARAAARRMAALLDEAVGATVGYAMRMDRQVSAATRILVVTEGVLARMILDDPELAGIACVVFDEFHERSLDGDFGLALALDVRQGLRPDLRLVVMSATLDGARVARLLGDAPVIESHGRSFPVDIRHRERTGGETLEDAVAAAVRAALSEEDGSILVFLPGQREIERTAERLAGRLPANADLIALFGAMDGKAQDAAIRPAPEGRRKIVLATAIAETSITIDGVRVVIDSGYQRLPKFEPATGLTRLETVRVSRASAEQRAGRAGRTAPGVAVRLWRAEQTASLPAFTPPEIAAADLAGLVLDCAAFGVVDPTSLAFLDPPPTAALAAARALLRDLGAIDETGRLTADGVAMRRLALPARLAHMVARAARDGAAVQAAELAVLLTERGLGGQQIDLDARLERFRRDRGPRAGNARALAKRLATAAGAGIRTGANAGATGAGRLLLHAWPDRVAMARGGPGRYVLANGRGGEIDPADPLAGHDFLVVADLQGKARNARIVTAAAVEEDDLRAVLAGRIETGTETGFDSDSGTVRAREKSRLGAITLAERPLPTPTGADADRAILAAVSAHGIAILRWGKKSTGLRRRLAWLRRGLGDPWPEMSDTALRETAGDWLAPFLTGSAAIADIADHTLAEALLARVDHNDQRRVEALAPTHFEVPSGNHIPIDYRDDAPVLAVRVQELFGLDRHPAIAAGTVPLTLELLSPAHRPIQTTRDLPGFWRGSWAEVRAAMRGRYPKHPWPEEPLRAEPTARAKSRGR